MARLAQRKPVGYVKAQLWVFRPALDVMRVHAALAAVTAGVLVALSYGLHPSLVFSGPAYVLIGPAVLPVPMAFARQLRLFAPTHRPDTVLNVLRRLLPTAQVWPRYAGLKSSDASVVFSGPSSRPPLMAENELRVLATDSTLSPAGLCDDWRETSASTFAVHLSDFTMRKAA